MRIAIVEDELKLAATLKEGLEDEGYTVDVFHDAESAEKSLLNRNAAYSLALLDLMLPGKDGLELSRSIRAEGIMTPILILTARSTTQDKVLLLDAGADDFLTKPFAFEELMARIRALTRRAEGFSLGKIAIENLVVDAKIRKVTRAGVDIALTPTEFDLLWLLVQNPQSYVTREEVSTLLWESKDGSLSNVVDVHISNLRRKIDDGHDTKIIRTVRGAGYSVQA